MKLYEVTGRREYLDLAKFFLDERGNHSTGRELFTYTDDPAQEQDHLPVIEQFEARGHAVRAGYQYAAMVDVASRTEAPGYVKAIGRLWEDVVHRKLYLTGGIGARLYGEAFDVAYKLFLNERLMSSNGEVGSTKEEEKPWYEPSSFCYIPDGDTLQLLIQVSNFHHRRGGFWQSIYMGGSEKVLGRKEMRRIFSYSTAGVLFFFMILVC